MNGTVRINTVNDVGPEMDGVAVVDVFTTQCAYPAHEGQPADGWRSRGAPALWGLDRGAYDAEHRRYAGNVIGMWFSSEEALDLLSLFAAPYLLSDACRLRSEDRRAGKE